MVEKHKLPVANQEAQKQENEIDDQADKQFESFTIDFTLKSLANNKQNDSTTTYYLLHKKWLNKLKQ